MLLEGIIACICEGNAEKAVMDILLDNNMLIFTKTDLLDEDILMCRDARSFEDKYLRKGFVDKITVLRILDSRSENFKLRKAYQNKVNVINIITAPEMEMLIIFKENRYNDFKRKKMKPSDYCKQILGYQDVKKYTFIEKYFSDVNELVRAIKEYKRVSKVRTNEKCLLDLLKISSLESCIYSE